MRQWKQNALLSCLVLSFASTVAGAPHGRNASDSEEISSLSRTRIAMRGNELPLATILNQIARSARLALVVDKDVKTDIKIPAVDLDSQPLDAALAVVLTPLGYSYEVDDERGFLRVFVYAVSTFKLSMPVVVQDWSTGITNGGDPTSAAGNASQGSSGGMGARVALSTRSDSTGLWDEVDKSLTRLLSTEASETVPVTKDNVPNRPALGTFSVNRVAGFVTVRALPSVMPSIESYFQALESEMGRGVVIELRVMQVDLNDAKAGGVDWSSAASSLGSFFLEAGSLLTGAASGAIFNGQASGQRAPFVRISHRAGDALVKALETQGTVNVLAQPTLVLGNNLPSLIELAEITSYVDQVSNTVVMGGAAQATVRTATVSNGLIISMMPRIQNGGEVSLALGMVLQEVLGIETFTFQGGAVQLPQTSRRSYSGVVQARVDETMVLGGLITTRKEKKNRGVPWLSNIPLLGIFFGTQEYVDKHSELIITLTPREVQYSKAETRPVKLEPTNP